MSRQRIAMIAPMLGGRPDTIPDVFERLGPLLARDHDVVLSSTRRSPLVRTAAMAGTVLRHRRSLDVVIVHLYSGRALATEDLVSRLARRRDLRLVGVLAGGGFPEFEGRHPRWVRRVLDRFDTLVAPSSHLGAWAEGLGFPVVAVPNPLDVADYPARSRSHVRPHLFWMRAYHEIYRPLVALDVIERVRRVDPEARLTMAGPDKGDRAVVEAAVADRGLDGIVEVRGFVDEATKRELFDRHDIFLNTPAVDNRPVCLVEAAASGLPVVSTDAGGIPSLVEHERSALLAPVDDPAALADAVVRLLGDADLVRRLTAGGRTVAEQGSPVRVLEAWNELLDRPVR